MDAVTEETKQVRDVLKERMKYVRVIMDEPYPSKEELAEHIEEWFDNDPILTSGLVLNWNRVNWIHVAIMSGIPFGVYEGQYD